MNKNTIEIPSNIVTKKQFDVWWINAARESEAPPRTAPPGGATVEAVLAEVQRRIVAGTIAELRAASHASPQYGTLDPDDPCANPAFDKAAHERAAEKKIPIMQATRELFAAVDPAQLVRPLTAGEERMRAFDRSRHAPPRPSLAEREAAVDSDPTIHAEAELMVAKEGIGYLDALRKIERIRDLEARLPEARREKP